MPTYTATIRSSSITEGGRHRHRGDGDFAHHNVHHACPRPPAVLDGRGHVRWREQRHARSQVGNGHASRDEQARPTWPRNASDSSHHQRLWLRSDDAANNTVCVFNDGAVGTVTAATTTSLTVTFSTTPATAGNLTAVVTTDCVSSGAGVQVATVAPVVDQGQHRQPGRQLRHAHDQRLWLRCTNGRQQITTVVFNNGAVGTVTAATATSLTISAFNRGRSTVGSLTAVVTTDGARRAAARRSRWPRSRQSRDEASAANLAANVNTLTISGYGFDSTAGNNTVSFNDGAVGTVTAAHRRLPLTVTFSTAPTTAGNLTAMVTTDLVSSGAAIQVATVTPVVTSSTASLAANGTTSLTINGFGFDPTAGNNTVVFNDGAVGTITTATATLLTATLSTSPTTAGSLTAVVTTDGVSSGAAVQVATVTLRS